jgi:hypothetical protein
MQSRLLELGYAGLVALAASALRAEELSFEQDVRPIFKAYCLDCHGGGEQIEGNLDLRLKRFAAKGGDSGPAVVAGNAPDSLLLARLKSGEMPAPRPCARSRKRCRRELTSRRKSGPIGFSSH